MLADTHCHLYFDAFQEDLALVLDRAWQAGLDRILLPGIDLETSRQAIELAEGNSGLFVSCGVHPNDAQNWNEETLLELRKLVRHPRVVAIGEIGLDFYHDRTPREIQERAFRDQLNLAAESSLPVVIHSRQAFVQTWDILAAWHVQLQQADSPLAARPGVLHSFEGSPDFARQAASRHFYIGIGGPVTYPNAFEKQEVVSEVPLNRLLLETDAPFLAPQRYRGKRNEPGYIPLVAEKVSQIKDVDVKEVARQTSTNANLLFHWSVIA